MQKKENSDSDSTAQIFDIGELITILEPGGDLSRFLGTYEVRSGQIDMLEMVGQAFQEGLPMIAEAGTGIGKSFAYLLPALKWALVHGERIIISTATIALQQQLIDKDIPMARKVLGQDIKVALVKGRNNYLCLKRLYEAMDEESGHFDTLAELDKLFEWAMESHNGEKSDIPFQPNSILWAKVRCEADACPAMYCEFFQDCFLFHSRREALEASLLVSNHHLLFADLAARQNGIDSDETGVLPPYAKIVFDEAHHIEAAATDLFSAQLSHSILNQSCNRLYRRQGRSITGLLKRLADFIPSMSDRFIKDIPPLIETVQEKSQILDILACNLLLKESVLRLATEPDEMEEEMLIKPMSDLHNALVKLSIAFSETIRELEDSSSDDATKALLIEADQSITALQQIISFIESFLHRSEYDDQVFWIENQRRSDSTQRLICHRTPLSVADMIRESVWKPYQGIVAVSATLAMAGNFEHWKNRIGANQMPREALEGIFPSPFDFASRVMLGIPTDAPVPEQRALWQEYLVSVCADAIEAVGGHALILFTSYETLNRVLEGVRSILSENAPLILAQGDDDRGRLIRRFRENAESVLFATDSFWEGVDIPGNALQLVIITRLPFRPPNDPVTEARGEAVAASGGNPFMEFTLPGALGRFRQGFGRLMRRRDDFGVVLILDPRILLKSYGPVFIDVLPPTFHCFKETGGVLRELEDFIALNDR